MLTANQLEAQPPWEEAISSFEPRSEKSWDEENETDEEMLGFQVFEETDQFRKAMRGANCYGGLFACFSFFEMTFTLGKIIAAFVRSAGIVLAKCEFGQCHNLGRATQTA